MRHFVSSWDPWNSFVSFYHQAHPASWSRCVNLSIVTWPLHCWELRAVCLARHLPRGLSYSVKRPIASPYCLLISRFQSGLLSLSFCSRCSFNQPAPNYGDLSFSNWVRLVSCWHSSGARSWFGHCCFTPQQVTKLDPVQLKWILLSSSCLCLRAADLHFCSLVRSPFDSFFSQRWFFQSWPAPRQHHLRLWASYLKFVVDFDEDFQRQRQLSS